MEMPKSAALYMRDYSALKRAEEPLHAFLDDVYLRAQQHLLSHKAALESGAKEWEIGTSKSTGRFEWVPESEWSHLLNGHGGTQLSILYRDVRSYDMDDGGWIRLSVYWRKPLQHRLLKLDAETLNDITQQTNMTMKKGEPLYKTWIKINVGNSEETANRVSDEMLRMSNDAERFITIVTNQFKSG